SFVAGNNSLSSCISSSTGDQMYFSYYSKVKNLQKSSRTWIRNLGRYQRYFFKR
ncbi:MAG: hypothetical protein ACI8Q1_001682, partial [Parvicella sp.]